MKLVSRYTRSAIILAMCLIAITFILVGFSQENWVDIDARKADNLVWRLSMAFAYTCVILLAITFSIGPVNILLKRSNPTHNPRRRSYAIVAAIMGLAHLAFAITIHSYGFDLLHQFVRFSDTGITLRIDRLGIANWIGLFQAGILLVLLILSTNTAIKRIGLPLWKTLQRTAYLAFVAIVAHGVLYQIIEERSLIIRAIFMSIIAIVVLLQLAGMVSRIRSDHINRSSV